MIDTLLGKPYKPGANGPNAYDCWGLVQVVQKELFGREMPDIRTPPTDNNPITMIKFIKNHPARKQWKKVDAPGHGRIVEMSRTSLPFHIGVYLDIDRGGILHCAQGLGVVFEPLIAMPVQGWRGLTYYDWVN